MTSTEHYSDKIHPVTSGKQTLLCLFFRREQVYMQDKKQPSKTLDCMSTKSRFKSKKDFFSVTYQNFSLTRASDSCWLQYRSQEPREQEASSFTFFGSWNANIVQVWITALHYNKAAATVKHFSKNHCRAAAEPSDFWVYFYTEVGKQNGSK